MFPKYIQANCFLYKVLLYALFLTNDIFLIASESNTDTHSIGKLRSSAELAFSKGEVDQSLNLWEQVIQLEPNNDSNYYKRYRVYIRQQKLKEALSDLTTAIRLNPSNENALVQRGKLYMKLGKCNEAIKDYQLLHG
jgi:tetratricopeptide (TPR) repeat protein